MPTLKCFKTELVSDQEKKLPHIILSTYLKKPDRGVGNLQSRKSSGKHLGLTRTRQWATQRGLLIPSLLLEVDTESAYLPQSTVCPISIAFGIIGHKSMSTESYHNTPNSWPTFRTKGCPCLKKKRTLPLHLLPPERYTTLKSTAADKQTPVIAKVISVHRPCAAKTK